MTKTRYLVARYPLVAPPYTQMVRFLPENRIIDIVYDPSKPCVVTVLTKDGGNHYAKRPLIWVNAEQIERYCSD